MSATISSSKSSFHITVLSLHEVSSSIISASLPKYQSFHLHQRACGKTVFVSVSGDPLSFLLQYRQDRWEGDPGCVLIEAALLDDEISQRFGMPWAAEHSMRSTAPVLPWDIAGTH